MLGLRELAIRSPLPLTVSHRICYTYNIFRWGGCYGRKCSCECAGSAGEEDASKGVLASLGVNTSDLINSAFDYLLERRELPTTAPSSRPSREELDAFLAASTLDVDWRGEAPMAIIALL